MLGKHLFPHIQIMDLNLVDKIMGVLLEIKLELLQMQELPESIRSKVDEPLWQF